MTEQPSRTSSGNTDAAAQPPDQPGQQPAGPVMTPERLRAFGVAWNNGDVDTLMSFMTDDCIYSASVGPEPGRTYRGRDEVRQGFAAMLSFDAAGESRDGPVVVCGTWGSAQWSYVFTEPDGTTTEVRGCDLFEFRGDKITRKDAFRKAAG